LARAGFHEKEFRQMKQAALDIQKVLDAPEQYLIDEVARD
jgi:hypothetical protein